LSEQRPTNDQSRSLADLARQLQELFRQLPKAVQVPFQVVYLALKIIWLISRWPRPETRLAIRLLICGMLVLALLFYIVDFRCPPQPSQEQLNDLLLGHCWLGYDPAEFDPTARRSPTSASMKRDLVKIRAAGFTGIVTFSAKGTLAIVPQLAHAAGLRVIMGVWNPNDADEVERAISQDTFADAYCIGHDGLGKPGGYTLSALEREVCHLKRRTQRPATVSEESRLYYDGYLVTLGDWLFPDVHLSLVQHPTALASANAERDVAAYLVSAKRLAELARKNQRLLMMLNMVVYPWNGAKGASLGSQQEFFAGLLEALQSPNIGLPMRVGLVAHGAFDAAWKKGKNFRGSYFYSWDPFTGLLDSHGSPRPAAQTIVEQCQ
jgi:hypothetical protein